MIPKSIPIYFDGHGIREVRGFFYKKDPEAAIIDADKDHCVTVAEMGRYLLEKDPSLTPRNLTVSIRSEFMKRLYEKMPKEEEVLAMRTIIPLSIAVAGGLAGGIIGFFVGSPTGPGAAVTTSEGTLLGFAVTADVVGTFLVGFNILESSHYADDSQLAQSIFVF